VSVAIQQAVEGAGMQTSLHVGRRPARVDAPKLRVHGSARGEHLIVASLLLADLVVLSGACGLAIAIRSRLDFLGISQDVPFSLLASSVAIVGIWMACLLIFGASNPRHLGAGAEVYRGVLMGTLGAIGVLGAVLFLADIPLSRPYVVVLFLVGATLLLSVRALARRGVNLARSRGLLRAEVLVIGSMGHVRGIVNTLRREVWLGYDVVGAVAPVSDESHGEVAGVPLLGDESHLLELVQNHRPDVVLFTAGSSASAEEFRRVAWQLEELEVGVIVVPGVSEISGDRIRMRPVAGLPLVHMDLPRSRKALKKGKRVFDVIASASLLLLLSPVLAVIAACVKLGDGGPAIFTQRRVGRGGEEIEFLKFRSMVTDAEERLKALQQQEPDRGNDVLFKMSDDPRITRVGKFLRRYSLDELPQLWNVLRGDMSLVGPRPALPSEVAEYDFDAHRRLAVRPGITGLWQVSGRSDLSWDDTVRLDLFYVDNWSFVQDLLILVRTVRAVVAPSGAY